MDPRATDPLKEMRGSVRPQKVLAGDFLGEGSQVGWTAPHPGSKPLGEERNGRDDRRSRKASPRLFEDVRGGLFLFAGEASGDQLGALLLRELRSSGVSDPIWGVGGERLIAEGFQCALPMEEFQIMGFVGVFTALPRLLRQLKLLAQLIVEREPKVVVLIDYPDFNLRLAGELRRQGYEGKIVQYVCPTVWAWRASRIPQMAERLDLLLTLFPFEPDYFAQTGLQAEYVGHPVVEKIKEGGEEHEEDLIAIFPGSRPSEIEHNLPLQLKAMRHLIDRKPELRCVISVARPSLAKRIESIARKSGVPCALDHADSPYLLMGRSQGAIATCGTVTLELALHKVPTVVTYRPSLLNAAIARFLFRVKLRYFCIANILMKQELFPERVHWLISPKEVARLLEPLITESSGREECLGGCRKLRALLAVEPHRAAEQVALLLKSPSGSPGR